MIKSRKKYPTSNMFTPCILIASNIFRLLSKKSGVATSLQKRGIKLLRRVVYSLFFLNSFLSSPLQAKTFNIEITIIKAENCNVETEASVGTVTTGYWEIYPFLNNLMLITMSPNHTYMAEGILSEDPKHLTDYIYVVDTRSDSSNFPKILLVFHFLNKNMNNIQALFSYTFYNNCRVHMYAESIQKKEIEL